jgi:ubiquinone/menaquinone biosynthesis C-methylase UbiE
LDDDLKAAVDFGPMGGLLMNNATRFQFTNPSVPKAYDEFLVPRLFEPWARLLLDEIDLRPGETVLDIATGPGTVARLAAMRVGLDGRIVATDIAPPMLEIARAKPTVSGAAPIDYIESPAAPLTAPSATFDKVLCQQGLQFFPDRQGALREMLRVLKPGGRVAIAVWGPLNRNKIYAAFHAALRAVDAIELADIITAPFSWHEASALKAAVEEVGFGETRVLTRSMDLVFEAGLEQAVKAFAGTPVAPAIATLPQVSRDAFFAALRQALSSLVKGGAVRGEMTSNILIANT